MAFRSAPNVNLEAEAMRNSSSRRQFLKQAATLPGFVAGLPESGSGSSSPRSQTASQISAAGNQLDSLVYSLSRYGEVQPSLAFRARTRAEATQWQRKLRERLIESLGGFPAQHGRLEPSVLRKEKMDGYVREPILFWSRPQLQVFGYLLIPDNLRRPGPAMICLPGHGRGVDDIVGIDKEGKQRKRTAAIRMTLPCNVSPMAWRPQYRQLGFGYRRDEAARRASAEKSSCQPAAGAALILRPWRAGVPGV
jgi:hypothetical protein